MGVLIRLATAADEDKVFQFLCDNYYPDEPLNLSVNRKVTTDKGDCPYLGYLSKGVSFLAVDEDQQDVILGLLLNKEIHKTGPSSTATDELIEKHKNKVYHKLLTFIKYIDGEFAKILEPYYAKSDTNQGFDVTVLSVRKDCRRQNIAGRLIEATINMAISKNHAFMTMYCSSAFSIMLGKRYGFVVVYEKPYKDYKDENGEIVFNCPPPHTAFTVLIKTLK